MELHVIGQLGLRVVVDSLACHSDLLFSYGVLDVPWSDIGVFASGDLKWSLPGPNEVDILEFVPLSDHTRDDSLLHAALDSVGGKSLPYWVNKSFNCWNRAFFEVHFSELAGI